MEEDGEGGDWRFGRELEMERFDMRPGEVDVEEEEKGAEAKDGWVELVVVAGEAVEEEVSVDLYLGVSLLFAVNRFVTISKFKA